MNLSTTNHKADGQSHRFSNSCSLSSRVPPSFSKIPHRSTNSARCVFSNGAHAFVALAAVLSLPKACRANTALPSDYEPFAYGVCSNAPVDPEEFASSGAYSSDNSDQLIAESVSLTMSDNGASCGYDNSLPDLASLLPQEFFAAAAQDLFHGFRLEEELTAVADFCNNLNTEENAISGNQCAQMCGVCVLVTGVNGNQIYAVNQIATQDQFGFLGQGIALHLGHEDGADVPQAIRGDVTEARKDIQFTRVPCPVLGSMYLIVRTSGSDEDVSFTPVNHQYGIQSMSIEKNGEQVALPRTLDNLFRYNPAEYSWQNGSIFDVTNDQTVRVTVTSQIADTQLDIASTTTAVVVCESVVVNVDGVGLSLVECESSGEEVVNFAQACVNEQACDLTNGARSPDCNPLEDDSTESTGGSGSTVENFLGGIIGGAIAGIIVIAIICMLLVRRKRKIASKKKKRYAFDAGSGANAHVGSGAPGADPFGTVNTANVVREDEITSPYGEYGEPYDTAFVGPTTRAP